MVASPAAAAGQPTPWGLGLQTSVTEIMDQIRWFETYTLVIITVITLFVLALLIWVIVRFNAKANPNPSKNTHNTLLEVVWTVVPVLILVAIAFPSFRLLYQQTTIPAPDMTVKMIAGQWYWQYEYMDEAYAPIGTITSNMLDDDDRAERMSEYQLTENDVPRLLAVDYPLVVPENTVVHVLTTSLDVNHAIAVPAFGIKADSIKGRLNESWFNATEPGIYYGQCSELCGRSHAFMPLEVRVLDKERFEEWAALAAEDLDKANEQLLAWQAEAGEVPVAALEN
ncbi:MAG: cytochrome c oxidase subunit II [Pseudomonadota bacterium]